MLRKRIIFTLIYNNAYFMQSRNFRLQRVGDINWLEKNFHLQKISFSLDELIVLNATRENKSIEQFAESIARLATNVFIPVAAGGGIRSLSDAEILFNNGADKIVLNSVLVQDPDLVRALVNKYGSQSVIASIDYKKNSQGINEVFIRDGMEKITYSLSEYIGYVQTLQVGEIYLNSMDKDGTGFGYDFETIESVKTNIKIPLIIAGGAGNERHLHDGLSLDHIHAVATANLYNFLNDGLPNARRKIVNEGMNVAPWAFS